MHNLKTISLVDRVSTKGVRYLVYSLGISHITSLYFSTIFYFTWLTGHLTSLATWFSFFPSSPLLQKISLVSFIGDNLQKSSIIQYSSLHLVIWHAFFFFKHDLIYFCGLTYRCVGGLWILAPEFTLTWPPKCISNWCQPSLLYY